MKNSTRHILEKTGIITVGSMVVAFFIYGFTFVIPRIISDISIKELSVALVVVAIVFSLVGWLAWSVENI